MPDFFHFFRKSVESRKRKGFNIQYLSSLVFFVGIWPTKADFRKNIGPLFSQISVHVDAKIYKNLN